MRDHYKIPTDRLAKKVIGSVRQATCTPVSHHQERPRWPSAFVERARSLGGHAVEGSDDALGHRASAGTARAGCKQFSSTVAMGDGGRVWSTEASRRSRPEKDGGHLRAICKVWGPLRAYA